MMQHKRSPISLEHSTSLTSLTPKRLKADMPISSKEKKEKFGERIVALQQLVSPYGKTDTASVLLEAMGYIKFLHEQVKVGLRQLFFFFFIYRNYNPARLIKDKKVCGAL
uniref:ER33 protein n=1 Tax=Solanum tuberosum TaxID=4113 RepID=M1B635_SOLTU